MDVSGRVVEDVRKFVERRFGVSLRPVQSEIFDALQRKFYSSPVKLAVLSAPTGTGKSLIAEGSVEYLNVFGDYTVGWYVVPTIHLQAQYLSDMRRYDLSSYVVLAGRTVYRCPYLTEKYGEKMSGLPYTAQDCIYLTGLREKGEECPYYFFSSVHEALKSPSEVTAMLTEKGWLWTWYHSESVPYIRYFKTDDISKTCPYYRARYLANRVHHVVANYDVFLIEWASGHQLRIPNLLVFDEAHVLFEKLQTRFSGSRNFSRILRKYGLEYDPPVFYGDYAVRMDAGVPPTMSSAFEYVISSLRSVLKDPKYRSRYYEVVTDLIDVESIFQVLSSFPAAYRGSKFYPSTGRLHLVVDPIRLLGTILRRYFLVERGLRTGELYDTPVDSRKVMVMSATVGDRRLWEMVAVHAGLRVDQDLVYLDFSAFGFPAEMRPVYYVPIYRLNRSNYIDYVEHFASIVVSALLTLKRLQDEGYYVRPAVVVHAYLRDAARLIYEAVSRLLSDYSSLGLRAYLAIADDELPIRDIIDAFVRNGGVLVSSTGAAEGVDFKDDISRLQFIFKAPIPGIDYDRRLLDFYIAKVIVQMAGRVARSADDFGATFIVDAVALDHYMAHHDTGYYPKYYREAVRIFHDINEAFRDYLSLFKRHVPKVMRGDVVPLPGGD